MDLLLYSHQRSLGQRRLSMYLDFERKYCLFAIESPTKKEKKLCQKTKNPHTQKAVYEGFTFLVCRIYSF